MKKIIKLFITTLWFIPLIMNAETQEGVIKLESDIHYEKDVENICEYYDKNDYIVGDWIYTFNKPEEKYYREITTEVKDLKIDRNIINSIRITSFDGFGSMLNIHELAITDKEGNKLDYKIKNLEYVNTELIEDKDEETYITINRIPHILIDFNEPQQIGDIIIETTYSMEVPPLSSLSFITFLNEDIYANQYDMTGTIIENSCIDNKLCHMKVSINEEKTYKEPISIRKLLYKYRDKYYKCYSIKNINIEEYIKKLNYIKIEDIQPIINSNKNTSDNSNTNNQLEIKQEPKPKNESLETEIVESVSKENKKLAVLTKSENKNTNNITEIYIISSILLVLIIIGVFLTKKVLKCRTK